MAYPSRPVLSPLPEFAGTATSRPSPELLDRLVAFVLAEYAAERSLREVAELTDRSFFALRNILDSRGGPLEPGERSAGPGRRGVVVDQV